MIIRGVKKKNYISRENGIDNFFFLYIIRAVTFLLPKFVLSVAPSHGRRLLFFGCDKKEEKKYYSLSLPIKDSNVFSKRACTVLSNIIILIRFSFAYKNDGTDEFQKPLDRKLFYGNRAQIFG